MAKETTIITVSAEEANLKDIEKEVEIQDDVTQQGCRQKMLKVMNHIAFLISLVCLILADIVVFMLTLTSCESNSEADTIYHWIGVTIGILFVLEVGCRAFAMGPKLFFSSFWNMLDVLVVVVTLAVELAADNTSGGIIAVLRVARVVRIFLFLMKHGSKVKNNLQAILKNDKTSLDFTLRILRSLVDSGTLSPENTSDVEKIIAIISSGKLYEQKIQLNEKDANDQELQAYLDQTFQPRATTDITRKTLRPLMSVKRVDAPLVSNLDQRIQVSMNSYQSPAVVNLIAQAHRWDFDTFALLNEVGTDSLFVMGMYIFQNSGLVAHFNMDVTKLQNFLFTVSSHYKAYNPYHNQLHGADVLHATNWFLRHGGSLEKTHQVTKLELLAAMLAALVHDVEHPGVNNNFCIQNSLPVAVLYNDLAVLENHHVSAAFRILSRDDCNILGCLSDDEFREVRRLMISCVLATDMSQHFNKMNQFKVQHANGALDYSKKEDRTFLLEMLVHFADVSNPAKPSNISFKWTHLVVEEFFRQGDLERSKGLTIGPMLDRNDTNIAKSQRGFIQYVIRPYFDIFVEAVLPANEASMLGGHLSKVCIAGCCSSAFCIHFAVG